MCAQTSFPGPATAKLACLQPSIQPGPTDLLLQHSAQLVLYLVVEETQQPPVGKHMWSVLLTMGDSPLGRAPLPHPGTCSTSGSHKRILVHLATQPPVTPAQSQGCRGGERSKKGNNSSWDLCDPHKLSFIKHLLASPITAFHLPYKDPGIWFLFCFVLVKTSMSRT